ncbi:MAG: hypothetical protein JWM86_602 [Thermoleophilia bacterium]|nr:hypothetical protein [Thermoleophilia bacterium]
MPRSDTPVRTPRWSHEVVEETLDGARLLTVSVVDRTIHGWWDQLARDCRIPARRWRRWWPHGTGPVVAMIEGRPAFDEAAWTQFASLVPGAVVLRRRTAEAFGIAPGELAPPGRGPGRLADLVDARRRRGHLRRSERRLETDLATMRARLDAQLDAALADGDDGTPVASLPAYALAARIAALVATGDLWAPAGIVDVAGGEATATLMRLLVAAGRSPGAALLDAAQLSAGGGRAVDPSMDALAALAELSRDARRDALAELLAGRVGWRAWRDLLLEAPPLRDDPDAVLSSVDALAAARDRPPIDPLPLDDLAPPLRDAAQRARRLTSLREQVTRDRAELHAGIRALATHLAERLVQAGSLPDVDAAFDLHLDDLLALARGTTTPSATRLQPGSSTRGSSADQLPARGLDGVLRGIPASTGVATGPSCVLDEPTLDAPLDGAILVCRVTDPAWMPLLARCAGLVTERGGPLSHAAIVARELGIPAVVGVAGARSALRDCLSVTVDGGAGTVSRAPDGSP